MLKQTLCADPGVVVHHDNAFTTSDGNNNILIPYLSTNLFSKIICCWKQEEHFLAQESTVWIVVLSF